MTEKNGEFFRRVEGAVRELIILADEGDELCQDDGCRVLSGVIRDCAYRLRMEIERERGGRAGMGPLLR